MKFTPNLYQKEIIEYIITHNRCAIWAGMGLGKTVSVLTALDCINSVSDIKALILAPLRVAINTWPIEAKKWNHLSSVDIICLAGKSEKQRIQELKNNKEFWVHVINYESVEWLIGYLGINWDYNTIVCDESTALKSFRVRNGGKRSGILAKKSFDEVERFIELTGTPSPNGLQDLWGQIWFLDKGERLGRSFYAFTQRWFQTGYNNYTIRPRENAAKEIQDRIKDICLTIRTEDYFNLDHPVVFKEFVYLDDKSMSLYKDMEDSMYCELSAQQNIEAVNAAVMTSKCLQIANGMVYNSEGVPISIHNHKLDFLEDILNSKSEERENVIVAYQFKSDLAKLLDRFPQGKVLDKNPLTVDKWNAGEIPILFAHPASAGHGLNLQYGGRTIVFYNLWWNLGEHQQIIERIGPARQHQAGFKRSVHVYYILAANTIDLMVLKRIETKKSTQDLLLEAMIARKNNDYHK